MNTEHPEVLRTNVYPGDLLGNSLFSSPTPGHVWEVLDGEGNVLESGWKSCEEDAEIVAKATAILLMLERKSSS